MFCWSIIGTRLASDYSRHVFQWLVIGILLMRGMAAQAGTMTEVRFLDQDPGSEPFLTRVLVTEDFLRLDGGEDKGDFVLLDRKSGQVVNVLHDQKLLMRMHNRRLPDTRPQDYKVEEKVIPVKETLNKSLRGRIAALRGARSLAYLLDMSRSLRSGRLALHPARGFIQHFLKAGTNRIQLYANGKLCSETVSARALLPDVAKALAEYKHALAYMQLQTYLNTPVELRQACDLAHHVWETDRSLAYGLPLEERDYAGRIRQFSGSTRKRSDPGLFRLPKGYMTMYPPEGTAP